MNSPRKNRYCRESVWAIQLKYSSGAEEMFSWYWLHASTKRSQPSYRFWNDRDSTGKIIAKEVHCHSKKWHWIRKRTTYQADNCYAMIKFKSLRGSRKITITDEEKDMKWIMIMKKSSYNQRLNRKYKSHEYLKYENQTSDRSVKNCEYRPSKWPLCSLCSQSHKPHIHRSSLCAWRLETSAD